MSREKPGTVGREVLVLVVVGAGLAVLWTAVGTWAVIQMIEALGRLP